MERSAARADLPLLVKGKDAAFTTTENRLIKIDRETLTAFPQVQEIPRGSDAERSELTSLILLLSKERKPLRK